MQRTESGLGSNLGGNGTLNAGNHLPINTPHQGSVEEPEKPKEEFPVKIDLNVISDNIGALRFLDLDPFFFAMPPISKRNLPSNRTFFPKRLNNTL